MDPENLGDLVVRNQMLRTPANCHPHITTEEYAQKSRQIWKFLNGISNASKISAKNIGISQKRLFDARLI